MLRNLRARRVASGHIMQTVADRLKVQRCTVVRWELCQREPPLRYCLALARLLHTTIEDLIGESP